MDNLIDWHFLNVHRKRPVYIYAPILFVALPVFANIILILNLDAVITLPITLPQSVEIFFAGTILTILANVMVLAFCPLQIQEYSDLELYRKSLTEKLENLESLKKTEEKNIIELAATEISRELSVTIEIANIIAKSIAGYANEKNYKEEHERLLKQLQQAPNKWKQLQDSKPFLRFLIAFVYSMVLFLTAYFVWIKLNQVLLVFEF